MDRIHKQVLLWICTLISTHCFAGKISELLEKKAQWDNQSHPTMHYCTVGCYPKSDPYSEMYRLFVSAEKHGLDIIHLGQNWEWQGNRTKIHIMYEYVKELPDEDIVIFTDAADVMYCAGEGEILEKFKSMDALVVCATERNCYPAHYRSRYRKEGSSFRYLNAGGYIGYAGALKHMLTGIIAGMDSRGSSDQRFFAKYYFSNENIITLDRDCSIFVCLFYVNFSDLDVATGRVFVKETKTTPAIIHGNGDRGRLVLERVYNSLYQ